MPDTKKNLNKIRCIFGFRFVFIVLIYVAQVFFISFYTETKNVTYKINVSLPNINDKMRYIRFDITETNE